MDIKITDDGDLKLGPPKVDEDGNVVLNEYGKPIRDFDFVRDRSVKKQMIYERLKTERFDWYTYLDIGNSLSDLVGQPNTEEVASRGVQEIINTLTYDGLVTLSEVFVKPIPMSEHEILFIIRITDQVDDPYSFYISFDLTKGVDLLDYSTD